MGREAKRLNLQRGNLSIVQNAKVRYCKANNRKTPRGW